MATYEEACAQFKETISQMKKETLKNTHAIKSLNLTNQDMRSIHSKLESQIVGLKYTINLMIDEPKLIKKIPPFTNSEGQKI